MRQNAEFFCHQISEPRHLEVGLRVNVSEEIWQTYNFIISIKEGFFAIVPEKSFLNQLPESKYNYLAFLFESLNDWLDNFPDYEVIDLDFQEKTTKQIKFQLICLVEGHLEEMTFEFEDLNDRMTIIFSSKHEQEIYMRIALLTVLDYLMTRVNSKIVLN